jgi:probable F420-dependent oxidoreductase
MTPPRPFRFGVSTRGAPSRDVWLTTARQAEDLGYSTLLMPDHLNTPLAPIPALAMAAGVTSSIRLGCYVFGNDFRNPVMLAKDATSLDILSNGRLELGLGTGWQRGDYEKTGIPMESPGTRVDRLAEAVQIIKSAFADEPFSFSGTYYTVRDHDLRYKPVQRPHPPILIGGGSPRLLSIAAREADIVGINFRTTAEGAYDATDLSAEATAQKVEWVRQAAGERFGDLELSVLIAISAITDGDPRQITEQAIQARRIQGAINVDQVVESPQTLVGSVERIVETLYARRERFGISYVVIRESDLGSGPSFMEAFAPVVARLTGK